MKLKYTLIMSLVLLALPYSAVAQPDPMLMAEGARVWANNCTRCHNARSSLEHNDREWITIVAHMRARANLTRSEGRAVAEFLKATNAPETALQVTPLPTGQVSRETESNGVGESSDIDTLSDEENIFLLSDIDMKRLIDFVRALNQYQSLHH